MKLRLATCSAASLLAAACAWSTAHAQDAAYVRGMAATCTYCHGTDGRSVDAVPALAGGDKANLVQQMQDFKTGKRPGTIMHQLAKGYTDQQIELLADYFSKQNAQ